jgi:hypothetical protein
VLGSLSAPPSALGDSDRLAWQASAAVAMLERFGELLTIALDAVGDGDDVAFTHALVERDRLVVQLEPLLGALASARSEAHAWPAPVPSLTAESADHWRDDPEATAAMTALTLARILAPVDDALQHAQHLHVRLSSEVGGRVTRRLTDRARTARPAAVALVR